MSAAGGPRRGNGLRIFPNEMHETTCQGEKSSI
ncbi:hypothetical protein DO72_5649 [Burkholderia pseudomallei]|nr:hypothetical protein DO72_5649 [Burkholderia pseudomallei]KGD51106.1 hypothetical protein DP43_5090 [Burkholderia pseudomallei]